MVVQLRQSQYLRREGYQLDELQEGEVTKSTTRKRSPGPEAMGNYGSVSNSQLRRSRRECRQAASGDGILIISGKF